MEPDAESVNVIEDKEEKNNLVKYDNDFVLSSNFNSLSSVQQDIFFSAVSFLCRDKTDHIVIPAAIIKARANLTDKKYTRTAYYTLLHGLEDIILKTIFTVHADGKEWKGSLFDTFAIDDESGDFEIFLNPHASHFFFSIPGPYSQFELQALLMLKSKYSKNLFRMLIAKYGGKWHPTAENLIEVFDLKNKRALSLMVHRLPKYIEDIKKTGYFENIKFSTVYDDKRQGRPLKSILFQFSGSQNKRNELRELSHWWGEQELSVEEQSYMLEGSQDNKPTENIEESVNKTVNAREITDIDLKCPICGSMFKKSYNPKSGTDFWGHRDYAYSNCCYAKKTFDTVEDLKAFIEFEQKVESQKASYRALVAQNPIARAAKEAADEQKAYLAETRNAIRRESGLQGIDESDIFASILKK